MKDIKFIVYIKDQEKENEYTLVLPIDDTELQKIVEEISNKIIITSENNLNITIDFIEELIETNEALWEIYDYGSYEINKIRALLEWGECRDLREAVDYMDNYILFEKAYSDGQIAKKYLDLFYDNEIPKSIREYFDYERFGRNIRHSSYGYQSTYGFIIRK